MAIAGFALLALFVWVAGGNWFLAVRYWATGTRASLIPILGGISGSIGLLLEPIEGTQPWFWAPLLLDLGSVPMLGLSLLHGLLHRK